ncbi:MAG: DUF4422 domain-containing protein [Clostridiales bacterium]|nr:DUF4422 domain-containing protein [Clostridiales bacterium]
MSVKILVVYHNNAHIVGNEIFTPILAGAKSKSSSTLLRDKILRDDLGENISSKNALYNELTAVYWAWKNYDKLGNPEHIGLCHYRRFFIFQKKRSPYYEAKQIDSQFPKTINYSQETVESLVESCDYVAPMPTKRTSVKLNYARAHRIEDLQAVWSIIDTKYPEYSNAAKNYFNGSKAYYYNMFIFDKNTFFRYCEWLFSILFEFESTAKRVPDRMYISERLTGVFFTKLEEEGKKASYLPTLYVTGQKPTLKEVIAQTKVNLKLKNSSKLYAFKPIILHFTPHFILRMRRSKRCK